MAIAVDCSGSIQARQLGLFEAEIRSILDGQQPRLVHVLYFDTQVHRHDTYQAGQPISLTPVGGGGTDFRPCFRWLEDKGIFPQTMVFLTDLWGEFPQTAPEYPVIWASAGTSRGPPPSEKSCPWLRRNSSRSCREGKTRPSIRRNLRRQKRRRAFSPSILRCGSISRHSPTTPSYFDISEPNLTEHRTYGTNMLTKWR